MKSRSNPGIYGRLPFAAAAGTLEYTMKTNQMYLPFDSAPEPFPAGHVTARVREQIDAAHAACEWFRDRQAILNILLEDPRLTTANQIKDSKP